MWDYLCIKFLMFVSCSVVSDSLQPHELYVAHQASPFMEFSRQEYCSGLPFPSPEDLPDPGIEPRSHTLQAISLPTEPPGKPKSESVYCSVLSDSLQVQAPLSMGFSTQEYWSGLPFPSPGDLPDPGIEPGSSCIVGRFFTV